MSVPGWTDDQERAAVLVLDDMNELAMKIASSVRKVRPKAVAVEFNQLAEMFRDVVANDEETIARILDR